MSTIVRKKISELKPHPLNEEIYGENESIDELVASGIIKKVEPYGLKVLAGGELEKKLTIKANKFTASAIQKIEKAGGTTEVL